MEILKADEQANVLRDGRCPHRDLPGGLGCWNCVRDALLHNEQAARDLLRETFALRRELDWAIASNAAHRVTERLLRERLKAHKRPQEARA